MPRRAAFATRSPEGRFTALYASDLLRVRQTAAPAAARLGLAPRLEPGLRERHYGSFQSLTFAEARATLPEDYARYMARDPEFDFGSGESLRDFSARAIACLETIARRHAGEEVLVFTHGGVLEMAYRRANAAGPVRTARLHHAERRAQLDRSGRALGSPRLGGMRAPRMKLAILDDYQRVALAIGRLERG